MNRRCVVALAVALAVGAAAPACSDDRADQPATVTAAGAAGAATTSPATTAPATAGPTATAPAVPAASTPATTAVDGAASTTTAESPEVDFVAEVWADNWFALYANGVLVGEDSVPITTERSFNAETISFRARYPLTIAVLAKDYKADDSGLEYLGTPRQQLGDGGIIAQVHERGTGRLVAATGETWVGLVVHRAPLDEGCATSSDPRTACRAEITPEPAGWSTPGFDARSWTAATVYTPAEVGVKEGYADIRWEPTASLIWSADLRRDNTILWRAPLAPAR